MPDRSDRIAEQDQKFAILPLAECMQPVDAAHANANGVCMKDLIGGCSHLLFAFDCLNRNACKGSGRSENLRIEDLAGALSEQELRDLIFAEGVDEKIEIS